MPVDPTLAKRRAVKQGRAMLHSLATPLLPRFATAALALLLALALVPNAPAQQPAKPSDQDAEYGACLELARKKPDEAVERAKKWWDAGGNFGPRHCLAIALVNKESYVQAAKLLEDLAEDAKDEIAPLKADLYNQSGQAYFLGGLNDQALAMHDRALRLKPRDVDFLIDRAVTSDEVGRHLDAVDDLNRAIDIAPDRAEAWLYRANAQRHLNNLDAALQDANRAVSLTGARSPEALLERATIKGLRKDTAGARSDLQAVVKLAPESIQGREAASRLKAMTAKPAAPPAPPKKPN